MGILKKHAEQTRRSERADGRLVLQFVIPWRMGAQQLVENSIYSHHGTCIACPDLPLSYGAQGLSADHGNWLLPASAGSRTTDVRSATMIIVKRLTISLFAAAVGALSVTNALAVPIDPNISISGSASFATGFSVAPTGTLTDLGDGFGITFSGSGSYDGGASAITKFVGDYSFTLSNTSLTDTYTV